MNIINNIIKAMQLKGYAVFENDTKPFNFNYVGIRDLSGVGSYNDIFALFWKYKGQWSQFIRMGTTDPGTYYLKNPLNVNGTAILKEGQYRGAWKLGLHQGKYKALVQRKEVTVIRDADRDQELDIHNGIEETGFFGINHHRSHSEAEVQKIGRYSAGCQVTQNPHEYDVFMSIYEESVEIWGEGITYTLLNINDVKL